MTASAPRRALRGLLGANRSHLLKPPAFGGYSVARRALAGLLGVRLVTREEQAGPIPSATGSSRGEDRHISAAAAIAMADPIMRLTVRQSPLIAAVLIADLLVDAVDIADNLRSSGGLAEDSDPARERTLSYGLDFDIVRALDRDLTRERERTHALDVALDVALNLVRALDRALSFARDRALDVDLDLARILARDRAPGADRARELAFVLARALSDSLGIEHHDGLADALLNGALDDFSQADLSGADLAHIALGGVHWSVSGTRWPPSLDVEALRQRSEETELGSGIYVITRRGEKERASEEVGV